MSRTNQEEGLVVDSDICYLCKSKFTFLYRRHRCRPCGRPVCHSCSQSKWDQDCVPRANNKKQETQVRVCDDCHKETGELHNLLRRGQVDAVSNFYRSKNHERFFMNRRSAFSDKGEYPVHIAARTGSLPLIKWLVEVMHCDLNVTSKTMNTPISVAANARKFEAVRYLYEKGARLGSIRERATLLDTLEMAMRRLIGDGGALPDGSDSSAGRRRSRNHTADGAHKVVDNAGLSEEEAVQLALAASRESANENRVAIGGGSTTSSNVISNNNAGLDEETALKTAIKNSALESRTSTSAGTRSRGGSRRTSLPLTDSAVLSAMLVRGDALPTAPVVASIVTVPPDDDNDDAGLPPVYGSEFSSSAPSAATAVGLPPSYSETFES